MSSDVQAMSKSSLQAGHEDASAMIESATNKASASTGDTRQGKGWVIDSLARMPPKTMLDQTAIAKAFDVSPRTIRRMVDRGELPAPKKLGTHRIWMVGRVLDFLDSGLAATELQAELRKPNRQVNGTGGN
jgi:hypothetical protein